MHTHMFSHTCTTHTHTHTHQIAAVCSDDVADEVKVVVAVLVQPRVGDAKLGPKPDPPIVKVHISRRPVESEPAVDGGWSGL